MVSDFHPKKIKLVPTKERLTNAAGLGTMVEVFDSSPLAAPFAKCLPERKSPRSFGSYRLGLLQVSSFLYGHDSIEDLDEFRDDPALTEIMDGQTAAPRTMGDFLRDFDDGNIRALNEYLPRMSVSIRDCINKVLPQGRRSLAPHLSIDSTIHVQSGNKMEGVAYNYKGEWGLASQEIYDEYGLCYGAQLQCGSEKSGVGAPELIGTAFGRWSFKDEKYLSGDSAYCYQDVILKCVKLGIKFTFTAHDGTTEWQSHIDDVTNWQPWKYSVTEEERAKRRGITLPRIDVGSFVWRPSWNEHLGFNVVVKRTWVEQKQGTLFEKEGWAYYGIVTNIWTSAIWTLQNIVEFHNKRGNCENFIREDKYGFDLTHLPCLKLIANHAFLLLGMVAQNILRWLAIVEKPDKPHFSKKLRRRFIYLPGKLVTHARTVVLKISQIAYEEVTRAKQAWQLSLQPAPVIGTS